MSHKESRFGILVVLAKIGPKVLSLLGKLAKSAKVGKVALAGASAVSYSWLFSWQFCVLLMGSLFIHEMGHIWAMRYCGLRTRGIYFIPFVGGAAVTQDQFPSRGAESFIAIAGPIAGLALTALAALAYLLTESPLFAAAAGWIGLVNLFNLLPINPLDGGRIWKSVAFSIHGKLGISFLILGMMSGIFLAFWLGIGLLAFMAIVGGVELLIELADRQKQDRHSLTTQVIEAELAKLQDGDPVLKPEKAEDGSSEPQLKSDFEYTRRHMPEMKPDEIAASVLSYLAVAGLLWWLMSQMAHVPEAELARQFFAS